MVVVVPVDRVLVVDRLDGHAEIGVLVAAQLSALAVLARGRSALVVGKRLLRLVVGRLSQLAILPVHVLLAKGREFLAGLVAEKARERVDCQLSGSSLAAVQAAAGRRRLRGSSERKRDEGGCELHSVEGGQMESRFYHRLADSRDLVRAPWVAELRGNAFLGHRAEKPRK